MWLQFIALIASGFVVGTGATLLALNASTFVYEKAAVVGIAAGFGAFALFFFARTALVGLMQRSVGDAEAYRGGVRMALQAMATVFRNGKPLAEEEARSLDEIADQAGDKLKQGSTLALAYFGAAASMGIAIAIVGSVISMAAVVAAHRQVDRMDLQNKLLEQQIQEAAATRISQVFAAQLPSLLEAIQKSRDSKGNWTLNGDLLGRIQTLIHATQPYTVDEDVNRWNEEIRQPAGSVSSGGGVKPMRFSPERGQLLAVLLAADFPFERHEFDFSQADLRGVTLRGRGEGYKDLGKINLSRSNLRNSNLSRINLQWSDLSGAILPTSEELREVLTWPASSIPNHQAVLRSKSTSTFEIMAVRGANLAGGILERVAGDLKKPGVFVIENEVREEMAVINPGRWQPKEYAEFYLLKERTTYAEMLAHLPNAALEAHHLWVAREPCNARLPAVLAFQAAIAAAERDVPDKRHGPIEGLRAAFKEREYISSCILFRMESK
ncbi:pentapeptide repeat-containing protein [Caenimonas sedimenti]|uniref:Pentapeptide repeat-containing protein n=1 Tax=Caenimonas sedimenti TaxID=2596921 RepID=A0A562ZGJ7_9BURK|nr:pentapeptide repeat-containing protein [Caenimonas sedimenti]TWO67029.1 pentapeptide repeat-containing protein [Caenimonas sedimenti]